MVRARLCGLFQRTTPPSIVDSFRCLRKKPVGPSEVRTRNIGTKWTDLWPQSQTLCRLTPHSSTARQFRRERTNNKYDMPLPKGSFYPFHWKWLITHKLACLIWSWHVHIRTGLRNCAIKLSTDENAFGVQTRINGAVVAHHFSAGWADLSVGNFRGSSLLVPNVVVINCFRPQVFPHSRKLPNFREN